MSNRIQKVNSLLEKEIGKIILRDFYFPETLVTLTHVDSSANLIEAKVYISVFFTRQSLGEGGPDGKVDKIIEILNKGAYSVQQKINKLLKMRPIPKIKFIKDKELVKAGRIEELLDNIKQVEKGDK
ncbi:MAG: 30S ribosome-binding factor RbfA [Candidatus Staskawiczbacteria bacterium]|nr:30S ribosome-binding factor RbfA [Candidatus Staskawiczbacteria bacterium]